MDRGLAFVGKRLPNAAEASGKGGSTVNGEVRGEGGGSPAERFWEEHYRASTRPSNGRPSGALVRFAGPLPGGTALDLGCSQGDDAIWLARRGWRVVAVDVSGTVLARAAKNAEAVGVSRSTWTLPGGTGSSLVPRNERPPARKVSPPSSPTTSSRSGASRDDPLLVPESRFDSN